MYKYYIKLVILILWAIHLTGIMTDFAQSLACYGQQQSTGIPMLGIIPRHLNHFGDFIPTREDLHQSIYLLFRNIFEFLYRHSLNGPFYGVQFGDSPELRRAFSERFGMDDLAAYLRARFYCFLLVNEYVMAQPNGPVFEMRRITFQEYLQIDMNERIALCAKFAMSNFFRSSLARQHEFVEEFVVIMETHRDAWDEPQLPQGQVTNLSVYLMYAEVRHNLLRMFPCNRESSDSIIEIERQFDYFLYCYHHYFRLGRRALPWHYDLRFHPRRPDAGDDEPEPIIPALPLFPQIDGHGGDI